MSNFKLIEESFCMWHINSPFYPYHYLTLVLAIARNSNKHVIYFLFITFLTKESLAGK